MLNCVEAPIGRRMKGWIQVLVVRKARCQMVPLNQRRVYDYSLNEYYVLKWRDLRCATI